jgi:hypothetical protein
MSMMRLVRFPVASSFLDRPARPSACRASISATSSSLYVWFVT